MRKYVFIDGNNILKKCFHIKKSKDEINVKTKGVYFFLKYLRHFTEKFSPHKIIVFWDGYNGGFYKHQIYTPYKANRKGKSWSSIKLTKKDSEDKETFSWQKNRVKAYLNTLGIDHIERELIEADDLIGLASQIINHQHIPDKVKPNPLSTEIHNLTKKFKHSFTNENFDKLVEFYEDYLNEDNQTNFKRLKNLGGLFFIDDEVFPTSKINRKGIYRAYSNILYNEDNIIRGVRVVIVSNDRDFIQLVNKNTSLYVTDQNIMIDKRFVETKIKTKPKNIIIQKTIFGDISDNIAGIKGCGDVTRKLFTEEYLKDDITLEGLVDTLKEDCNTNSVKPKLKKVMTPLFSDIDNHRDKYKIIDITNPILRMGDHEAVIDLLIDGSDNVDIEAFEREYKTDNLIDYLNSKSHTSSSFLTPFYKYKKKFESEANYIIKREKTSVKRKDYKIDKRSPFWYEDENYRDWFIEEHGIEVLDKMKTDLLAGGRLISCGDISENVCRELLEILNL